MRVRRVAWKGLTASSSMAAAGVDESIGCGDEHTAVAEERCTYYIFIIQVLEVVVVEVLCDG